MIGFYDFRLVALSVFIAIFAAYAALDLAGRTTASRGKVRLAWLTGGAAAMGLGIWSMHYIAMLAFRLPVPVLYDWPTVLVSLLAAVFASGVALFVVSRPRMGWRRALIGSAIMGSGIATMHYIGMAAMRLNAICHYDPLLWVLSVVLAIVVSLVALWLTFHLRDDTKASGDLLRAHCQQISLVILDVTMPRLNGREAYAQMRVVMPDLPVVFTTGHSVEAASLESNILAGAAFLQKPYDLPLLYRIVRRTLDSRHSD
jgi:NO-binding membrane sensor protein with MHYT domain